MNVGLHTTCAMQQEDSSLQQKVYSDNDMPTHLKQLFQGATQVCNDGCQQSQIREILVIYQHVFSRTSSDVGSTDLIQHSIPLLPNSDPIHHAPRRSRRERAAEVEKQVDDLVAKNLIEPAFSNWSSPIVLVKKKDDNLRFWVDNR